MSKSGFTLLETVIYLAIFSFIITSVFGISWQLMPDLQNLKEKILFQEDILYAFNVLDRFSETTDLSKLIPLRDNPIRLENSVLMENEKYKLIKITILSKFGTSTYAIKKYK